jgi:hypothetical protein
MGIALAITFWLIAILSIKRELANPAPSRLSCAGVVIFDIWLIYAGIWATFHR